MIKNKAKFFQGIALAVVFFIILSCLFAPFFEGGTNGLQFADAMFNKLAKGSSYFIPMLNKNNEQNMNTDFSLEVTLKKAQEAATAKTVFSTAGATVDVKDATVVIKGNLGKVLAAAISDSDAMYNNDGKKISDKYGIDAKEAMRSWWTVLSKLSKNFQKEVKVPESDSVNKVVKKGIEPAYNFYGVVPQQVSEKIGIMTGLLIFYVFYTILWGYAIFFFFEGIGLTMAKSKVKKEA